MKDKESFTLVEILVVTTIIALLAAVTAVSYSQLGKQSRDNRRKTDIEQIRAALEMYRSNDANGYYTTADYNNSCSSYTGLSGYIASMPTDPKTSYYYRCNISKTNNTYAIGGYLETGTVGSPNCGDCATGIACNYCVGPYGVQ